jgi:hypothetical protein
VNGLGVGPFVLLLLVLQNLNLSAQVADIAFQMPLVAGRLLGIDPPVQRRDFVLDMCSRRSSGLSA